MGINQELEEEVAKSYSEWFKSLIAQNEVLMTNRPTSAKKMWTVVERPLLIWADISADIFDDPYNVQHQMYS